MERKMFKAENNSTTSAGGERSAWFSLLVKSPSPGLGMFAIGLMRVRKLNLVFDNNLSSSERRNYQLQLWFEDAQYLINLKILCTKFKHYLTYKIGNWGGTVLPHSNSS